LTTLSHDRSPTMPALTLVHTPDASSESLTAESAAISAFNHWSFDDGTEVVSRSIETIDGIPVCIERWRMDRTVGESIVVPLLRAPAP